jgi:hypothetical protein
MDVAVVTMDKRAAREAFQHYQAAVRMNRGSTRKAWAKEDRALMQAHKALAKGQAVLNLEAAFASAGVFAFGESASGGYPKLAVCRSDEPQCRVTMWPDGSARFEADRGNQWTRSPKATHTVLATETFPRYNGLTRGMTWTHTAVTPVPIVPPQYRPKFDLGNYHTLWEVESWTQVPPIDPMLLKHLGGALYVVLATWDLTDIERAVLSSTGRAH